MIRLPTGLICGMRKRDIPIRLAKERARFLEVRSRAEKSSCDGFDVIADMPLDEAVRLVAASDTDMLAIALRGSSRAAFLRICEAVSDELRDSIIDRAVLIGPVRMIDAVHAQKSILAMRRAEDADI